MRTRWRGSWQELICWTLLLSMAVGLAAPRTNRPWQDMDYGPFLSASIEANGPETNIAFKGIAIRLRDQHGKPCPEAVMFDTDLLRYGAGWTGNFVALKGVVFDGEHWAYPRIDGEQIWGNGMIPGWARGGSFADPRPFIYGPLPREWAHWKGLYLHGEEVVLAYTVGTRPVLEQPSIERGAEMAFARTLNVAAGEEEMTVQVATEAEAGVRVLNGDTFALQDNGDAQNSIAYFVAAQTLSDRANAGEVGAEGLLREWKFEGEQNFVTHNARWGTGKSGRGLELAGTGMAELATGTELEFLSHDMSFTAWIRTRGDGVVWSQAAAEGPWVPDAKALFVRNGKLTFDIGWVGAVEAQRPVPKNRWCHVAFTWSQKEGVITLYVDGRKEGQAVLKPRKPTKGHILRLGFSAPNFPASPWFHGTMDDLQLYTRTLKVSEVGALAGATGSTDPLLAAVVGAPAGTRWVTDAPGELRLRLSGSKANCKILLARVPTNRLGNFAALVRASVPARDLESLTKGGPARWEQEVVTQGKMGPNSGPLAVDTITWPESNPWNSWMRFGGLDFMPDGKRVAISTWNGDVWMVNGIDGDLQQLRWRRFATGLYQPLGLKVVGGQIYVLGRDQITRLHDLNGDGEADWFENFNNDTQNTEHFHEFALDLQTDTNGNFYYMKAGRHARPALHPQHGTLMRVSADGAKSELLAKGFRAPNGLEVTPQGEWLTTDQEGYWMPANRLNLIKPGGFYGNAWSWFPEGAPAKDNPPMAWIHPKVDRSPSTLSYVSSGQWGPLEGRLLSLSYGVGRIFLVLREEVNGMVQGGIVPLPVEFDTGIMRARFHPGNGHLYVCGLFGWAGNKTQAGGFFRVRNTGKPLNLPCGMHAANNGIVLDFTDPLDPASANDAGNYSVEAWNYRWTENYGSPDFKANGEPGRDRWRVESAVCGAEGKRVFLKIPDLHPAMQVHVQMNLKAADGAPIQTYVHATVHQLGPAWAELSLAQSQSVERAAMQEAPGLVQTFSAGAGSDTRSSRLLALRVPAGDPPTDMLEPRPFTCTWRGFIKLDLSGDYAFHAAGRGRLEMKVNGVLAIPRKALTDVPDQANPQVALKGGLNAVEVIYESASENESFVRVFWSNPKLPREPVPPTVLVHDADNPELTVRRELRLGRQLVATRFCTRCHEPDQLWPATAMPELRVEGPSLEGAGDRFNASWLAKWALNPAGMVPDTAMPACLTETNSPTASAQAQEIAAYLATLRTNLQAVLPAPDAEQAKVGEGLYITLGCAACHYLPNEQRLDPETRRPLAHVRAKWQPHALPGFLRKPGANYAWNPMPDFQLSGAEAAALAAFVLSRTDVPGSETPGGGSPERGRQLFASAGCASCHSVSSKGMTGDVLQPRLRSLSSFVRHPGSWTNGCLAVARSPKAPWFSFDSKQRQAIRKFLSIGVLSLSQHTFQEFAHRQLDALRCGACHQRDNVGDAWSVLEARAAAQAPKQANPYEDEEPATTTIHRVRPPLTWAGEKLRAEWTERLLLGQVTYKPRPKLTARMPLFPAYAAGLAHGLALDHGITPDSAPVEPTQGELARAGDRLIRKGALACVDCHEVGNEPALAGTDTATINFAHIPDRLRKEYYERYLDDPQRLLPGTMMPRFSNEENQTGVTEWFGGNARQQFEAIWQFMRTIPPPSRP